MPVEKVQSNNLPDPIVISKKDCRIYFNTEEYKTEEDITMYLSLSKVFPKGTSVKELERQLKFAKLDYLKVTVGGHTYDADLKALQRIRDAITYREQVTLSWKLADNSIVEVSYLDLEEVIKEASAATRSIIGVE